MGALADRVMSGPGMQFTAPDLPALPWAQPRPGVGGNDCVGLRQARGAQQGPHGGPGGVNQPGPHPRGPQPSGPGHATGTPKLLPFANARERRKEMTPTPPVQRSDGKRLVWSRKGRAANSAMFLVAAQCCPRRQSLGRSPRSAFGVTPSYPLGGPGLSPPANSREKPAALDARATRDDFVQAMDPQAVATTAWAFAKLEGRDFLHGDNFRKGFAQVVNFLANSRQYVLTISERATDVFKGEWPSVVYESPTARNI